MKCECGCGQETTISRGKSRRFISGHNAWKHRMSHSPEYKVYTQALYRCINPNEQAYKDYGGRGIKFLFKSFNEFIADIGPRPSGRELDRIDTNGHYAPGNVRWATNLEQVLNRRPVKNATGFKGVRKHHNKFIAQICINYKNHHLGMFKTPELAAAAFIEADKKRRQACL